MSIDLDAWIDDALGLDTPGGGVDWQPFPDKPQERAYYSEADVIGFGGAGGGGKTDLMLGKAFTQFQRAFIFRRAFVDLAGIVERGDEILDGLASFVWGWKRAWELPDGRVVRLAAADKLKAARKYKGRPKDFIGIDEADEFDKETVDFLTGWLRTDDPDQRTQVMMCFNPPHGAGEWLLDYFAPWLDDQYGNPAEDGEIRWFAQIDDVDTEINEDDLPKYPHAKSRTFFKALVDDNPVYMATGYDKQLESLHEPLRSQLRWGDFSAGAKDDAWQVIPTQWVVDAQNRWLEGQRPDVALRAVGVDPSRGGDDETTIAKLYGTWFELISHPGTSVPDGQTAARLVTDALGEENAPIALDALAIGSSVYDHLKILENITVNPINVGAASEAHDKSDRYQMFNLRSEMYWKFREALDPASGENICLPPDRQLRADLTAARYSTVGGKIKIELKDKTKERLGRSPDRGEAIMLAWLAAQSSGIHLDFV